MKTSKLNLIANPTVINKFNNYPYKPKKALLNIRKLIIETAQELEEINELEESLKWNQPSYKTKLGSTLRIDWNENNPNKYAIYFQCTSKLIPTFKQVYNEIFQYENNRAIILNLDDTPPKEELKNCISRALIYHKIKNKPLLNL